MWSLGMCWLLPYYEFLEHNLLAPRERSHFKSFSVQTDKLPSKKPVRGLYSYNVYES